MAIGGSLSVGLIGLKAFIIQIQAFISPGLPYFSVIGLPDASLSESRERVKSACQASGFKWPDTRVTVNMSPASMPKRGASHDLAIAAGVLSAAGAIPHDSLEETIVLGEVNLDGTVLPIHGLLPIMLHAKERGIRRLIVPYGNEDESRLVPQMDVTCVRHVGELIELAGGRASYTLGVDRATVSCTVEDTPAFSGLGDMSEVVGQDHVKWALQVAAAGKHHLLMTGPPGSGKTMLASRMPSIMCPLTPEEQLEVASIRSLCGTLQHYGISDMPPFEAPHHTASTASLVGGGSGLAMPGAITRAHRGILFMDEAPEFSARTLQTLREPMESGYVALSRTKGTTYYPAMFQMVRAANPCPCGYAYGNGERCVCKEKDRIRYFARLSGPILDRIDIQVEVPPVPCIASAPTRDSIGSHVMQQQVIAARAAAGERYSKYGWGCNAEVPGSWMRANTSVKALELANRALASHRLSLRGVDHATGMDAGRSGGQNVAGAGRDVARHHVESEDVMTVCESDSGLCWDLDEETLARAILTFCLNTADALMTALLKGTADAWEALTLIRDSDPELRTSAGAGKVIEQAFCIGMTRWGSKPTPQAVRSFRSALATWQQRLRTLPTWDRDYLCGWFTMEGRQWIIAPHDVWWPTRLNDLALLGRCAPPLCLWGSGDRAALTSCPQPVGIVGSRGVNEYGRRLTTDIAVHAAQAGHLVVSGGAMGVDAAAHRGALDAMRAYGIGRAGRTVAVFAGGLNHAGPQCNSELFDGIAENGGALVSELCPGTIPEARRFLSRNRIIAALSSTLVVTQARLRSGALNTVNWGSELQRDIHAVPGNIDMPGNGGCNRLIQEQRATIVCSVADMDDVWHAPHPPESFHDVATQRKDGSDCDVGTPRDAGILRDSSPSGGNRSSAMTESQRAIIDAIRWCRRRRIAPTAQSVAEQLRTRSGEKGLETGATEGKPTEGKSTEGKGADAVPERGMHELVAHVLSQLGAMELIGLITVENGRISIVPETGGRRRS